MPTCKNVLVLFNIPCASEANGQTHHESDAGVLAEVKAVCEALESLNRPHRQLGVSNIADVIEALQNSSEEIVFNLVESLPGHAFNAALIPALCEAYGKGCTGGDTPGLVAAQDKWKSKDLLATADIPCPKACIVPLKHSVPQERIPAPNLIVKPVFGDASEGIHAASVIDNNDNAITQAVAYVHRTFNQPALIEEFVGLRELNVSVIERNGVPETLPIAEIDFSSFDTDRPRIVSYEAKWLTETFEYNHTPRMIPAPLSPAENEQVRNVVLCAWKALGCRDYARIDLRLTEKGEPVVIEINPNPDISPDAGFVAALQAAGMDFAEFVKLTITNAECRAFHVSPEDTSPRSEDFNIRGMDTSDIPAILSIVEATDAFRPNEVEIAREVLCHAAAGFNQDTYISDVVEHNGRIAGWICFGETACTIGTFDIYWIAVAPEAQRFGLGRKLVDHAVRHITDCNGRMVIAETSGQESYAGTRAFYERIGFHEASRIADFYAPGDDKVVYVLHTPRR